MLVQAYFVIQAEKGGNARPERRCQQKQEKACGSLGSKREASEKDDHNTKPATS